MKTVLPLSVVCALLAFAPAAVAAEGRAAAGEPEASAFERSVSPDVLASQARTGTSVPAAKDAERSHFIAPDAKANRILLDFASPIAFSNAAATTEAAEPLTPAHNSACNDTTDTIVNGTAVGSRLGRTHWYQVTGDGSPVTVYTGGGDTVVGIYTGNIATPTAVACDDDGQGQVGGPSLVTFNATSGQAYFIQVGGWCANACNGADINNPLPATGTFSADYYDPPDAGNDDRASAVAVTAGSSVPAFNFGTTFESGEDLECPNQPNGSGGTYNAPLGKTVWFKFTSPGPGDAVFSATGTGFDSVVQVFRGTSGTPVACNDDGTTVAGPSRVPVRLEGGDYFIQVGGFDYTAINDGIQQNSFNLATEYTRDTDLDNDGVVGSSFGGGDCNDSNAGIKPGATDVPDNGVDEDCNGADAKTPIPPPDTDGDGFLDAVDRCPALHRGAFDRDNNGCPGPRSIVRISTSFQLLPRSASTLRFVSLTVKANRGVRVAVTCSKRACSRQALAAKTLKFKRFQKTIKLGTVVQIRATKRGSIGAYVRYKIVRRGGTLRLQKTELCIPAVGSSKPAKRCNANV